MSFNCLVIREEGVVIPRTRTWACFEPVGLYPVGFAQSTGSYSIDGLDEFQEGVFL